LIVAIKNCYNPVRMSSVSNSIEMAAPPAEVFGVVSNLVSWPRYLPHYRWIRVMENHPDHQIVRMACYRGWLPIDWVSRFSTNHDTHEIQFEHLKAFTKGMKVVWKLDPITDGQATRVTIFHDLDPVRKRLGKPVAEKVIGEFFINFVATRTLKSFAGYFRQQTAPKRGDSLVVSE
jgi:ribosome-associated toxin RatA of RatAB toxin-antitoxin module